MKNTLDYGCDICGDRFDWENEIIWLNSGYGVCPKCYDTLSETEKERLYDE